MSRLSLALRDLLGARAEGAREALAHDLDLGVAAQHGQRRRLGVGVVQPALHGLLHDARRGRDAAVVQVDERAVVGEGARDLGPVVLVLRHLPGRHVRRRRGRQRDARALRVETRARRHRRQDQGAEHLAPVQVGHPRTPGGGAAYLR
jgi:hypothetical protein